MGRDEMELDEKNSKIVLELLVKSGIITENDITSLTLARPLTEGIAKAVDIVHTMLCKASHREDSLACKYYIEQDNDDPWGEPFHRLWLRKTMKMMEELQLETDDKILKFLRDVTSVVGGLETTKENYPNCDAVLKSFLWKVMY